MTESTNNPDTPSPRRPPRLNTMGSVRRELARVYADARSGSLQPSIAAKLAYVLTCLQKTLEWEIVEQRLDALERNAPTTPGSVDHDHKRPAAH